MRATYKQSKLLKEKGFDIPCQWTWCKSSRKKPLLHTHELRCAPNKFGKFLEDHDWNNIDLGVNLNKVECSAPEYDLIEEWLVKEKNIYIHFSLQPKDDDYDEGFVKNCVWWVSVYKGQVFMFEWGSKITEGIEDFPTRNAAFSAALDHILEKLI